MICKECGSRNNGNNKFCINCGNDLTTENECSKCGSENDAVNKFCINCGKPLKNFNSGRLYENAGRYPDSKKQTGKQKGNQKKKYNANQKSVTSLKFRNRNGFKVLWITTGIIISSVLVIAIFDLLFHKYPDIPVEIKSSSLVEAEVTEIASKFVCSCGTCGEESLELCTCPTAIKERNFIRNSLEKNINYEEVVYQTANKYGWLKQEFAGNYKVDNSKVWNPVKGESQTTQDNYSENLGNKKAAISDKSIIYSAFNCPCGQCSLDELKNCNCPHPNGAKEIKKFIDEIIIKNKYTVNEIIDIVNNKFGGKKI